MERRALIESLASTIAALGPSWPVRVAIDGVDASGKSTLANELASSIEALGRPAIRASIDGFHNAAATRSRRGPTSPEGYFYDSCDHDSLIENLLQPLGPGGNLAFRRAVFDFRTDQPVQAPLERAQPNAVLIFDGVFLLRPELREYFDFSIFLRVDFGVALARAEERDLNLFGSVQEVRRRYHNRYIPGQRLYLAQVQPERWASSVINNNDPLRPIVEHAFQQGAEADTGKPHGHDLWYGSGGRRGYPSAGHQGSLVQLSAQPLGGARVATCSGTVHSKLFASLTGLRRILHTEAQETSVIKNAHPVSHGR